MIIKIFIIKYNKGVNKTPTFVPMGKFIWTRANDGQIAKCEPFNM